MKDSVSNKTELYLKEARAFFKGLKINSQFSMYGGDYPTSAKITFNNKVVDYKLEPDKKLQIIHYTNIQSFCDIINSQSIRLYDCNNLNDAKEIEIGLNRLGFKYEEKWLNELKRTHFIFSASEYDGQEDFNIWRLYGDKGHGIALVFEIEENFKSWKGIHLAKINYSTEDENFSRIKDYVNFHIKFQEEHNLFVEIPSIIPLISAFQKNDIWSIEKEFRIVATCLYDNHTLETSTFGSINPFIKSTLNQTVNSSGKLVSYLELPISEKYVHDKLSHLQDLGLKDQILKIHPVLKLKKVIFGPDLKGTSKGESLWDYCYNIISLKIGENVAVINSQF